MAVVDKAKKLVVMQKGNESTKVLEEFVADYKKAGWKQVKVVKGKRDKDGKFLEGESDKVTLVGLEEETVAGLKAEIVALKKEVANLKKVTDK